MLTSQCRCGGELEMRRKKKISGGDGLVWQCVEVSCSRIHGPVAARDLLDIESALVPTAFNWVHHVKKPQPNSRRREYAAALKSAHYRKVRDEVLERDHHRCTIRLDGCLGQATTADHITYERLGRELPSDLRAACNPCNLAARSQRITKHVLGGA